MYETTMSTTTNDVRASALVIGDGLQEMLRDVQPAELSEARP